MPKESSSALINHKLQQHPEIGVKLFDYLQSRVDAIIAKGEIAYPDHEVAKLAEKEGIGVKLQIHRRFLYGIQLARENNKRGSIARVIAEFEKNPDFLHNNPAFACLDPFINGSSRLIVVDGHHRIRNASRILNIDQFGRTRPHYPLIPTRVFTFAQYVDLLNRSNPNLHLGVEEKRYTEQSFKEEALLRAALVEREMSRYVKPDHMPIPLRSINTIEQLVEQFGNKASQP